MIGLVGVRGLFAKDRDVGPLQRSIGELDIDVRQLEATTIVSCHFFYADESAKDRLLMSRAWKGFPRGNTARYLQLDAGVVSHLNEIFEGNRACKCIDLHL